MQLRTFDLLFDVQVGDALHALYFGFDAVADREHAVQVRAEEFDGDVGLRAGKHGVDAVRDGLADLDVHARQGLELRADLGQHLVLRTFAQLERRLDFRGVHAQGVFVQFGASRFAGHGLDFGNREQQLLGAAAYAVGLLERNARERADVDRERPFVERRQETAPLREKQSQGHGEQHGQRPQHEAFAAQRPFQGRFVPPLEVAHDERIAVQPFAAVAAQQVAAQHGGQRQRHERRGEQRRDERDAQRPQHAPLHAREEEERHEADDDDEGRIENRHPHLARGVEDHLQRSAPFGLGQAAVLAQAFVDVLHIDDGVVYQRPDGDGHTADAHGVDRQTHEFECQDRHQQRQRDRDQRNERRADVHQEEEQHDDDEHAAFVERFADVVDRTVDEPLLAEDVRRDLHVGRQRRPQVGDRGVEFFRQVERRGGGLLGDGHQHGVFGPVRGRAQFRRLGPDLDFGDVLQRHGHAAHALDHRLAQRLDPVGREDAADDVFVAEFVENAACGVGVHVVGRGHHLVESDAVVAHLIGRQQDLVLLDVAAQHRDLRHAAH